MPGQPDEPPRPSPPPNHRATKRNGWLIVAAAFLLALPFVGDTSNQGTDRNPPHAEDRTTRFMMRAAQRAGIVEQLNAKMRGMSREEARAYGMRMARLGVSRLGDSLQLERGRLVLALLESDSAICRTFSQGDVAPADAPHLLDDVDSVTLDRWAEVSMSAERAELQHTRPRPTLTEADYETLAADLHLALGDSAFARWAVLETGPTALTPAESCWATRAMLRALLQLPAPTAARHLRTLATEDARALLASSSTP